MERVTFLRICDKILRHVKTDNLRFTFTYWHNPRRLMDYREIEQCF